eukprot:TRINITY_DN9976_c0_g2_i2.p1 TRINITY_DN9976_c0_g2~~TRINITY_DN9976_c0_g2_i2.p1  ORF type:complete len:863 (-),score=202.36 TRINITY_DN9976_c0_g2_i2:15-2570(-)
MPRPHRPFAVAFRRFAAASSPAEEASTLPSSSGGSSSSSSRSQGLAACTTSIFDSVEKAQEMLALSQRNLSEELYQEVKRRRERFQIPQQPIRSLSSAAASVMNPLKLLSRLRKNPKEPPVTSERAEGMVAAMEITLRELTSSVLDIEVPKEGANPRLVVVGDIHGQLQDVLHIFEENGPPSEEVAYLFNGDIVDRGRHAVEIWLLIIAFKLTYPRSVYVLRGNHENEQMISRPFKMGGGFAEECLSKYSQSVLAAFQRMFKLLPLFAVLDEEIFIVHGGLFRNPKVRMQTLRDLPAAAWHRNYPNPLTKEQTLRGDKWTEEEEILFDAQWADPHYGSGSRPSSRGRVAVTFGEDVTKRFLDDAGLALCLRSHRVPQTGAGYELEHDGRLLTLFSASRYGGVLQNRGAVAIVRSAGIGDVEAGFSESAWGQMAVMRHRTSKPELRRLHMTVVEHDVSPLKSEESQQACVLQVRRFVESMDREHQYDVEQHALALICSERATLWSHLRELDRSGSGYVSRNSLCEVLAEVCGELGWPAILVQAAPELGERVSYGEFLAAPSVRWFHLGAAQVVTVARATAQAELRLSGLAALFDSPNGQVTPSLAREALGQLLPSLRERQRHQLATSLFGEETNQLSAVLHQLALFADPPKLEPWMQGALRRILSLVLVNYGPPPIHSALIRFFKDVAQKGSDLIGPKEFVAGIQNLGSLESVRTDDGEQVPYLHTGRLYKLFEAIDGNGSGTVSFLELLLAMDERTARPELPEFPALEGTVPAMLLVHKAAMLKLCRSMDPMDTGRISAGNFVELVIALFNVLGRPLAACQRVAISEELSGEDLAYSELLSSFEVRAEGWA